VKAEVVDFCLDIEEMMKANTNPAIKKRLEEYILYDPFA